MNHIDATVFVPDPRKVTRCRGAKKMRSRQPDEKPATDGNLAIAPVSRGKVPHAEVVRPAQADGMRAAGVPTFRSHWATCPKADQFRYRARNRQS